MPSSSYIAAAQALYDGLADALFPGGARPKGPYLGEAPATASSSQLRPPYVVIRDMGAEAKWTFSGAAGQNTPGQNALVTGEFVIEAYALTLADSDAIVAAVLWGGQVPNRRAGLAFAAFTLTSPEKGVGGPVPTKTQREYVAADKSGARVHATKQWFTVKFAYSGDGL